MGKIGLIAGGGTLPIEFIRSARKEGANVAVFAIRGMASPEIEKEAERVYWMDVGEFIKFAFLFLKEGIRKLFFLGRIEKNIIYDITKSYDTYGKLSLKSIRDKKDTTIFEGLLSRLKIIGIEVGRPTDYLSSLLPDKGILSRTRPDKRIEDDTNFGYNIAKEIAGMDIGQTVIVKDKAVVAVEAMEGTDASIERAGKIAGEGCIMIKVSRPNQDLRWDIPTVGSDTMQLLLKNEFSALAIESGKVFLLEKEKMINLADSQGIVFQAI